MSDIWTPFYEVFLLIIKTVVVLGIFAFVLALSSLLFVAAVEGWEKAKRKIKQLKERKKK